MIRQLTAIDKVEIGREKSMPEWITRYWVEWLFGIVAALAAASYRRVSRHMRHTQKKDQSLDDGMRALLRDRIISACDHYFEKGFAPVYARENITSMYDAYHSLGGDGIVTDMVKQAMELPYKKGGEAPVEQSAGIPRCNQYIKEERSMNINWKIRFQNKTFLTGLISLVVVFIYDLLQLLGIAPVVTQSAVMQVAEGILTVLGMLGVIADPTTAGLSDSKQALTYTSPKQD